MSATNGMTVDKTISWLLVGMAAVVFLFLTIAGMQRVEATAEKAKQGTVAPKTVEPQIDIHGEMD